MINAASPGYLKRFGVPQTIDDLLNQGYRMVHYMRNFGAKPDGWNYLSGDGYNSLMLLGDDGQQRIRLP